MRRRYKTNTKLAKVVDLLLESGLFLFAVGVLMVFLSIMFYVIVFSLPALSLGYIEPISLTNFNVINLFGFKINGIPILWCLWAWAIILTFTGFIISSVNSLLGDLLKDIRGFTKEVEK